VYLLAHVGLTVLAWEALRRLFPARRAMAAPLLAVAVGALLPDLLDKPLGHLVLRWDAGRLFAHTLLFTLALGLAAWAACRRSPRAGALLGALAFGSGAHLLLDRMWQEPGVLLWPLLGAMPHGHWDASRYATLPFTSPWVLVMEGVGLVLLVAAWWLAQGALPGKAMAREPAPTRRGR
jgi:hypothetical protein